MSAMQVLCSLLLAFALTMYVVLDGMDLGVGVTLLAERNERHRGTMISAIAPVWDANETWIVLGAVILFEAFSTAYAILLPALYVPLLAMVLALAFRGAAFELRFQSANHVFWDRAFAYGSIVAACAQGAVVGAVLSGIAVGPDLRFAGSPLDFMRSPLVLMTTITAPLAYGFVGSAWLAFNTSADLQLRSARRAQVCGVLFACAELVTMLLAWFVQGASASQRWPVTSGLIAVSWCAVACTLSALRARSSAKPYLGALASVVVAVVAFFASLWPVIVPPHVSVQTASTDQGAPGLLLIGIAVVVPIILAYSCYAYYVFRGKTPAKGGVG